MKIQWTKNSFGQTGFVTERSEYDAVLPIDSLMMDNAPLLINPEREAVAAFLAFGSFASGEFQLSRKFGPATAEALVKASDPVPLYPHPIEYYPKPLPGGLRSCFVGTDISVLSQEQEIAELSFAVLRSDQWNGSIVAHHAFGVASNAFLIDAMRKSNNIRAQLAVAVLFAEDFNVDYFVVSSDLVNDPEEQKFIENLLLVCKLGIVFS